MAFWPPTYTVFMSPVTTTACVNARVRRQTFRIEMLHVSRLIDHENRSPVVLDLAGCADVSQLPAAPHPGRACHRSDAARLNRGQDCYSLLE